MVYFLAVFIFHSIATMPAVYWTKEACEGAGKQMGVRYSCLGVQSGPARPLVQTPFEYPILDPNKVIKADDGVDWEARRRFMHRAFQEIREGMKDTK